MDEQLHKLYRLIPAPVDQTKHSYRLSLGEGDYKIFQDEKLLVQGQISKDFSGFKGADDNEIDEDDELMYIMKDPVLKKKLLSLQDELEHIDEYIVSENHDGDAKDAPSKPS